MERTATLIRCVWTAAFLIGAFNHARDLIGGGWLPYVWAPLPLNIFWSALLPVDLTVAALLWWRPRWGVGAGLAVMVADVAINTSYWLAQPTPGFAPALQWQTLFLGFTIGSAPLLLRAGR